MSETLTLAPTQTLEATEAATQPAPQAEASLTLENIATSQIIYRGPSEMAKEAMRHYAPEYERYDPIVRSIN